MFKKGILGDKEMLFFSIPGTPVTWHRPGQSPNGHRYDTQKEHKDTLQLLIKRAMSKQSSKKNSFPLKGPVIFQANFYYPVPKARNHFDGQPCPTYGDVDNLTKLILDVLQSAGAFANDRQVYALQVTKRYAHQARTDVEVTEVKSEKQTRLDEHEDE